MATQEKDPRPVPPSRPENSDCCGGGCIPCVFDYYEDQMDIYREKLRAWEERQNKAASFNLIANVVPRLISQLATYNKHACWCTNQHAFIGIQYKEFIVASDTPIPVLSQHTYPFDARGVAKRFRHAAIFGALAALHPGETMRFCNDHDPLPLLQQLQGHFGDNIKIDYVTRQPGEIVIDFQMLA